MAPGKKKKKPVSNPARQYATKSVASKDPQGQSSSGDASQGEEGAGKPDAAADKDDEQHVIVQAKDEAKETSEMTSEELEAHLERADLQAFVEKFREQVKRDAQRQISKYRAEKRLLRAQGIPLAIDFPALQSELLAFVQYSIDAAHSNKKLNASDLSNEYLTAQLWKLSIILPALELPQNDTEEILRFVVHATGIRETNLKDPSWGLSDVFEWTASWSLSHEITAYEGTTSAGAESVYAEDYDSATKDLCNHTRPSSNASDNDLPNHSLFDGSPPHNSSRLGADTVSSDESDGELEPEQLTERYLELKTELFHLDPQVIATKPPKGRKAANAIDGGLNQAQRNRIKKLLARLQHITSDVLFEQREADALWHLKFANLSLEESNKRRWAAEDATEPMSKKLIPQEKLDSDQDGYSVGALFEQNHDIDVQSEMSTLEGVKVHIRDFGSFQGLSPRRVLEETLRAKDRAIKINYKIISKNTYSCRHSLHVQWSKRQDLSIVDPHFIGIEAKQATQLHQQFEMMSIACANEPQSESFISTVAHFALLKKSVKEEKAHFRLPQVWRDLWAECVEKTQDRDDQEERQTIRNIRQLLSISADVVQGLQPNNSPEASDATVQSASTAISLKGAPRVAPEETWRLKVTSPAYERMLQGRQNLPIYDFRHDILSAIESNQVVIVCGATGCGKSTQVPAYILEQELSNGRDCKIYCSEPRRISAISLARRVSQELGEGKSAVGARDSLVGYAIRLESRISAMSRLIYATTGILLRMLEESRELDQISHLILDEVHERSIESDFLLVVLRRLLKDRPCLKLVLMSATVDAEKFSNYLGAAPVFEVPGRTFPVETRFLEDAIDITHFKLNESAKEAEVEEDDDPVAKPSSNKTNESDLSYSKETRATLTQWNEYRISYDLIVQLLEQVVTDSDYGKATLVFLPGIAEIRRLSDTLRATPIFFQNCDIFALHSSIAMEEQEKAFLLPSPGRRKIVLATNIAETGITIPDITCVIDTGKHKELRYDERRQLSRLTESFISQANAMQRRGRAGRVQKGLCFHLFTRNRFDRMPPSQTPEILRLSLQDLVLRVKICKLGNIEETLAEAMDPPSSKNIQRAVSALQDAGALAADQSLTALGDQLARLPLDVSLGKLLILGTVLGCMDAVLTIAAILSSKSPFSSSFENRSQADNAKMLFKKGNSDLLTLYNAYSAWRRICNTTGISEYSFCRKQCLSVPTLLGIEDVKAQLMTALSDAGFIILGSDEKSLVNKPRHPHGRRNFVPVLDKYNQHNSDDILVCSLIGMAFYPRLLRREGKGWRNVMNNQIVSIHPTSVNKTAENTVQWLSFYHIMQSGGGKSYNAHETSALSDLAVALLCGEAEFKMYAGVIVVDSNRVRFAVKDWQTMTILRALRSGLKGIVDARIRKPDGALTKQQEKFMELRHRVFTQG